MLEIMIKSTMDIKLNVPSTNLYVEEREREKRKRERERVTFFFDRKRNWKS